MNEITQSDSTNRKKAYHQPQLTCFGALQDLTRNGTGSLPEDVAGPGPGGNCGNTAYSLVTPCP